MNVPKYVQNNERLGTCSKKKLPYVLNKDQLINILSNVDYIKFGALLFLVISMAVVMPDDRYSRARII